MDGYLEDDLIEAFNRGEKKAFDELYRLYYSRLYYFSFAMLNNREESQDIVIDTINKLFQKHTDFATLGNIKAFLYITVRNSCLNYLRHMKVEYDAKNRLIKNLTEADEMNDQLDAEYIYAVRQAIDRLPARQREVVEFLYFSDKKYSYKEIAKKMGVTVKTVENHRLRALAILREMFQLGNIAVAVSLLIAYAIFILTGAGGF